MINTAENAHGKLPARWHRQRWETTNVSWQHQALLAARRASFTTRAWPANPL